MFKWVIKRELNNSLKMIERIEHVIFLKVKLIIIRLVDIYMYDVFDLVIKKLMNYLRRMLLKI